MGEADGSALRTAAASSRYRVDGEIARGGMGVVFRAFDRATGRAVALKRPLADASSGHVRSWPQGPTSTPRHQVLLEREFRTLVDIKHPRVIEVYDYGFDAEGPYYTMELLDGDDLKTASPVPYRALCGYLRDIASSLALLHARGFAHRDVSPSNVRITSDGRAKLIDFGALVPFGRHDVVAGTPACVAPEALDGLELDQRVDLFALGATAYHALTGRAAYPARALTQLPSLWSRGGLAPPSALVAGIPAALDELVLSLLALDPLSRPVSAADVIDRLGAITDLPQEDDEAVVRSYLTSPVLVGRDEARSRVAARIKRMVSGRGGVLLIEGSVGLGKSALLRELERESRLLGARVFAINARAHQSPFGTCRALLELSVTELGDVARACVPTDLFDSPSGALLLEPDERAELPPDRRIERIVSAFVELARLAPIVLAIDDGDHADLDSIAALSVLSEQLNEHSLSIALAADADSASEQVALRVLRRISVRVRVTPLTTAELERLTRAMFGDAPGVRRLSAFLVEQTSGNPMLSMELLTEFVNTRAIRYEDGAWVLPQSYPDAPAASTTVVLERRLARLGPHALALAECMSAQHTSLSVDACRRLAQNELGLSTEDAIGALDELLSQRVLVGDGRFFAFTQMHLRQVLYRHLEPARKRRVHRQLAESLQKDLGDDPCRWLEVGCHFSFAGDERRAAAFLRPAVGTLTRRGDALVRALPDLRALHAHYVALGLDEGHGLRATMPLVIAGLYANPQVQDQIGSRTLDLLERRSGFGLSKRLCGWLGARIALVLGLVYGFLRHHLFASRVYRFHTFSYPLAYFGAAASMTGVAALRLDRAMHARLASRLSFVSKLPLQNAARVVYEIACLGPLYGTGRFADAAPRLATLLADMKDVRHVDEHSRAQFEHALRFWVGRMGLLKHGTGTLAEADRMAQSPSHHDRLLAEYLRFAHHLWRGETALAEPFRDRLDALAARYGSSWAGDLLVATEFVPYHLSSDVVGLKRCILQLESLVGEHPHLAVHHEVARAMYEGHRGRPERALAMYRALGEKIGAFADPIWSHAEAHAAECLNAMGDFAAARARAERALAHVGQASVELVGAYQQLERELAIACAGLGELAQASLRLDTLLERDGDRDQPLLVGLLHRDRARVAILDRDRDAFFLHADEARVRFRTAQNPALVAQAKKLADDAHRVGLEADSGLSYAEDFAAEMDQALPSTSARADRGSAAQRVLDYLVALVGASRARLYVRREGRGQLAAQFGEDRWEYHLDNDVDELMRSFAHEHEHTAERTGQLLARSQSTASHVLVPLLCIEDGQTVVVGAVAVAGASRMSELGFDRLERLSATLRAQLATEASPH